MRINKRQPMGLKYDEWVIGKEYHGMVRTVTETDAMMMEYLSGDHVDEPFYYVDEKGKPVSRPYVAGLLTLALVQGAITRTLILDGVEIAMLSNTVKFVDSVHTNDTLYSVLVPVAKRRSKSMPGAAIVDCEIKAYNQNDDLVLEVGWTIMVGETYEDAIKYNLDETES